MSLRKLTLGEWFTYYQLQHVNRSHFHVGSVLEADISEVYQSWVEYLPEGKKPPLTFILAKAAGLLLEHEPHANRQFCHGLFGKRIYTAETCAVNIPVLREFNGEDYLSLATVKEVNTKSIDAIKKEVVQYLKTPKEDLLLGKFIIGKPNTFWNRLRLKSIHKMVNLFPKIMDKYGAGTISVSSMLNLEHHGTDVIMQGRGPGAHSITLSHFDKNTLRIRMGVCWDHYTEGGLMGTRAIITLCRILQNELSPGALFPPTDQ